MPLLRDGARYVGLVRGDVFYHRFAYGIDRFLPYRLLSQDQKQRLTANALPHLRCGSEPDTSSRACHKDDILLAFQVPGVRLLIGARGQSPVGVDSLPLDLTQLASVRSFSAAVEERLGETSIDALVLNAAVSPGNADQRTADGFETTFAVNHLAHYLLLRLLMPRLAFGAIVVITTSDTHDPKAVPFGSPEHADAHKLAQGKSGSAPKRNLRDSALTQHPNSAIY